MNRHIARLLLLWLFVSQASAWAMVDRVTAAKYHYGCAVEAIVDAGASAPLSARDLSIRSLSGVEGNMGQGASFSFTGYTEDKETSQLYAKARYYDSDTGRFLSQDAWEGETDTPPSLHRYLYAYQNPTVYTDKTGNCVEPVSGALCLMGALAVGNTLYDVATSDRREKVYNRMQPKSFGGQVAAEAAALGGAAANTVTAGYFDAAENGVKGIVEHTKENILPINASANSYNAFSEGNYVEGALYAAKAAGQVATVGLIAEGVRQTVTPKLNVERTDGIGTTKKSVDEVVNVVNKKELPPEPRSLSDIKTREWYQQQINKIDIVEKQLRTEGKSLKEIYETTSPMRNEIKQTARDLMKDQVKAKELPIIKSPQEHLDLHGGDYEKALEAVKRTNSKVNKHIEERRNNGEK